MQWLARATKPLLDPENESLSSHGSSAASDFLARRLSYCNSETLRAGHQIGFLPRISSSIQGLLQAFPTAEFSVYLLMIFLLLRRILVKSGTGEKVRRNFSRIVWTLLLVGGFP